MPRRCGRSARSWRQRPSTRHAAPATTCWRWRRPAGSPRRGWTRCWRWWAWRELATAARAGSRLGWHSGWGSRRRCSSSPRCCRRRCCGAGTPELHDRTLVAMRGIQQVRAAVRRHPRWADGGLAVVLVLLNALSVILSLAVAEGVYPETLVLVAVYTLALYRPRRYLWPALVVLEGSLLVAVLLGGPRAGPWNSLALGTSALAAAALLGVTVSTRRAYLGELEERARRAERERDQRAQRAQLAVAAERARIAREMHDIVA